MQFILRAFENDATIHFAGSRRQNRGEEAINKLPRDDVAEKRGQKSIGDE